MLFRFARRVFVLASPELGDLASLELGDAFALRDGLVRLDGGEMPVAAAYISELSRAQGRGRFFLLYEIIFPVGLMATGQIGTLLVPLLGWKILFLIGGIPGLILAGLVARLPESPRWLISQGRLSEAEAVIASAEASAARKHPGFEPKGLSDGDSSETDSAVPAAETPGVIGQASRWRELLSPVYRRRTLIVWALWASAFFVANGLNNWMPTLYHEVYGLDLREALRAASMTNVAQVVMLILCAFTIDRIGRRNWTVGSFIVGALLLGTLALGGTKDLTLVMLLATLAYGAIGSIAAVLYLYTPEVYPTRMRATGTSWMLGIGRFGVVKLAAQLIHDIDHRIELFVDRFSRHCSLCFGPLPLSRHQFLMSGIGLMVEILNQFVARVT